MVSPISISDNARGKSLSLTEQQRADLDLIAGYTVKELIKMDEKGYSLLVFPDSLDTYGDSIEDETILSFRNNTISTGNLMGFIGCHNTRLRIHSRFDTEGNDYFMHYLLERVFSLNLFDLKYSTEKDSVFDLIIYLFPFFLNRALSQGLYREYVTYQHNDARMKGAFDAAKHLKANIPFLGKIAYQTREHSSDNCLTELIRHTIEYIRTKDFGPGILTRNEETRENVAIITEATPRYEKNDRQSVISRNLRSKIHPYYAEYEPLRRLCLQILRQEELKYGQNDDTVYGVLFDGAWLWEEYLHTLLFYLGFNHPENKKRLGAIHLFQKGRAPRYPDFYNSFTVLDAKYKKYADNQGDSSGKISGIAREDLAQVISYMYVLRLSNGGFLVPGGEKLEMKEEILNGYGGIMYLINLPIPKGESSYSDFCKSIRQNEEEFCTTITNINSSKVGL